MITNLTLLMLPLAGLLGLGMEDNPPKLATTGRFDLAADAVVGSVEDGQIVTGSGSVQRMNWGATYSEKDFENIKTEGFDHVRRLKGIQFPGPPEKPLVPDASLNLSSGTLDWINRYNTQPTETNPSSPRAFRAVVEQAKEWSDYYGRPVHFGEFGAYIAADAQSRANFYRAFRETLDSAGIGWAMWDWKAGFRYWDEKAGTPAPGLREALFPNRTK